MIEIKTEQGIFRGFNELTITKSLNAVSGTFSVDCFVGDRNPFLEGSKIEVRHNGEALFFGFIEVMEDEKSKDQVSVSMSGREVSCDLVDCSVVSNRDNFEKYTLLAIAHVILEPFGIRVVSRSKVASNVKVKKWKINEGESAYACISRLARMLGVTVYTEDDQVVLSDADSFLENPNHICEGDKLLSVSGGSKIKKISRRSNLSGIFSDYVIKGKDNTLLGSAQALGRSKDESLGRYRPITIIESDAIDRELAETRAKWEAAYRSASAKVYRVVMAGWERNGRLFRIGEKVRLSSEHYDIYSEEMVVSSVTYRLTKKENETIELELSSKNAYRPRPVIKNLDRLKRVL